MPATAQAVAALISLLAAASPGTVELPRSGQVTCWDETGAVIACAGTGQDGDVLAGLALPDPRFTDNGDGTITDLLTGLTWLQDANCADTVSYDPDSTGTGEVKWLNALAFVDGINDGTFVTCQAGHTKGWRLPNINELMSLHDFSAIAPGLTMGHPFTNLNSGSQVYWSSTSNWSNGAWTVGFYTGNVGYAAKGFQNHKVLPVRGTNTGPLMLPVTGQTRCYDADGVVIPCTGTGQDGEHELGVGWPYPRFQTGPAGVVTDHLTGLSWLADMSCASTAGYDPDTTGDGTTTWQHALDFVQEVNQGLHPDCGAGQTGWRLPNTIELTSLLSPRAVDPQTHLPTVGFTNVPTTWTWSSTSYGGASDNMFASTPEDAHAMALGGSWARIDKTDTLPFLLVKTAPAPALSFFRAFFSTRQEDSPARASAP